MKAYLLTDADSETIALTNVPVPTPGPGELLVRLQAIGVGIHDSYFLPPGAAGALPIGIEGAGVVEEIGGEVPGYHPGTGSRSSTSCSPRVGPGPSSRWSMRTR
ncbi:hypothetical protein CFK39_08785 [Brachybacterium avium]|uniref:Alcohol dehydrogenase-like N-terminal domain-containing protein n=1 Tax=Brachybacterium avium TaxID=2017485 RepID=A0A220UCH0_9MICO|nr:hypothetical protein [Brachybacterium avium]ASK65908.1 hypothetical protein CFK39_08785 [Brachybacterium avium]